MQRRPEFLIVWHINIKLKLLKIRNFVKNQPTWTRISDQPEVYIRTFVIYPDYKKTRRLSLKYDYTDKLSPNKSHVPSSLG